MKVRFSIALVAVGSFGAAAAARAEVLVCPKIGRIEIGGDTATIAYGDGMGGYRGANVAVFDSKKDGYTYYQIGQTRDLIIIQDALLEGRVKNGNVSYLIPDERNYGDACTLESGPVVWTLDCAAPGQRINGAKYTDVSGTIELNLTTRKLSVDVVEKSLPPFTPQTWRFGDPEVPISVKTERLDHSDAEVLRWELRADSALTGPQTENYYTVDFPVLASSGDFPSEDDVAVSVTHTIVSRPAPGQETGKSGYEMKCRKRP